MKVQTHAIYLSHHGVWRDSAVTTKLLVVFDASCKTNLGLSLNDMLMVSATLQDTLVEIILRFRICPIVMTDLQKIYRQILIHECDQDYQRILIRRFSPDEQLQEYRLNTVTYDQSCAPFLAIRSVRQLASEGENQYPRAARVILRDL